MTTVYVLLAECKLSGGVTADAYPTSQSAWEAGEKLLNSEYPCNVRVLRIDPDNSCELIVKGHVRMVKSS